MAGNRIDILGIDPGSQRTGWGIVRESGGRLELIDCGLVRASQAGDGEFSARLAEIFRSLRQIILEHAPDEAAVEQVFASRNPMSALKLGQARGAAVAACASADLRVFDYEPTLIKKSLTGTGRAEKEQVAFMARRLLNMGEEKKYAPDVTDALAAAICHAANRRFLALSEKITKAAQGARRKG